MNVNFEKLTMLLKILKESEVSEFEHEDNEVRLRIVLGKVVDHTEHYKTAPSVHLVQATEPHVAVPEASLDMIDVTSPFVGTFYRAGSPDAQPFVDVGSTVKPGQALCIIEAMKLMNEIEAEFSGTIVEIFAQNGKPVEFGQKLFRIKKA